MLFTSLESGYKFHVQFHITNVCNLKCIHCYEGRQLGIVHWGFNEFKCAIDKLWSAFAKWGVKGEISLIGGEPTLHPEFESIVKYLHDRGDIDSISILTNGVHLTEKLIDTINDNNCLVQVSIDGINEEAHDNIRGKGNYLKLLNGIQRLQEKGISPSVHYVLSRQTTPISQQLFENLHQLGIYQVSFSRLVPYGNASFDDMLSASEIKETLTFLKSMKDIYENKGLHIGSTRPLWCNFGYNGRCPVGIQTITILENGDILPCRRLPIVLGNIKKDSFYQIWYTSSVLNDIRDRQSIIKCGKCEHLDICGGARCLAYAVYGDYMQRDPQCWL